MKNVEWWIEEGIDLEAQHAGWLGRGMSACVPQGTWDGLVRLGCVEHGGSEGPLWSRYLLRGVSCQERRRLSREACFAATDVGGTAKE